MATQKTCDRCNGLIVSENLRLLKLGDVVYCINISHYREYSKDLCESCETAILKDGVSVTPKQADSSGRISKAEPRTGVVIPRVWTQPDPVYPEGDDLPQKDCRGRWLPVEVGEFDTAYFYNLPDCSDKSVAPLDCDKWRMNANAKLRHEADDPTPIWLMGEREKSGNVRFYRVRLMNSNQLASSFISPEHGYLGESHAGKTVV